MTISIKCDCGRTVEFPDEKAGAPAECPECGRTIYVSAGGDEDSLEVSEETEVFEMEASDANVCPKCKNEMAEDAVLCTGCGWHKGLGRFMSTKQTVEEETPSAPVALVKGVGGYLRERYDEHQGLVIGGVALLVVIVGIVFWVSGQREVVTRDAREAAAKGRGMGAVYGDAKVKYDQGKRQARAIADAPKADEMYLNARSYVRAKQYDRARGELDRLLSSYPKSQAAVKGRALFKEIKEKTEPAAPQTAPTPAEAQPAPAARQPARIDAKGLAAADAELKKAVQLLREGRRKEAVQKLEDLVAVYETSGVGVAAAELLKHVQPPKKAR